jgi:hypothetical protein
MSEEDDDFNLLNLLASAADEASMDVDENAEPDSAVLGENEEMVDTVAQREADLAALVLESTVGVLKKTSQSQYASRMATYKVSSSHSFHCISKLSLYF